MRSDEGIIIRSVGGFYYVETSHRIYECKVRGILRKKRVVPLVGDHVKISCFEHSISMIEDVLPRKNQLIRPPLANLDQLVIVSSVCDPLPSLLMIDQMIAFSIANAIDPILVVSKVDLQGSESLSELYRQVGIHTVRVSLHSEEGILSLKECLKGKSSAFAGNSGVGKSTLINRLLKKDVAVTGEISSKLGRGKHTTRTVEFFRLEDAYIVDTPGFSNIEIQRYIGTDQRILELCFYEFTPYLHSCAFHSCSHVKEKGCAIREAVSYGKIAQSRYDSYIYMYQKLEERKHWKRK